MRLTGLADNNADCKSKGRGSDKRGAKNPKARLTAEIVATVRRLREEGATQQFIADEIGFSQNKVSKILRGIGWIPENIEV